MIELNFLTLLLGTVLFGGLIAWLARQEKIISTFEESEAPNERA